MFAGKWIVGLVVGLALSAFGLTRTAVASIEVVWYLQGNTASGVYATAEAEGGILGGDTDHFYYETGSHSVTLKRYVNTTVPEDLWPALPTSAPVSIRLRREGDLATNANSDDVLASVWETWSLPGYYASFGQHIHHDDQHPSWDSDYTWTMSFNMDVPRMWSFSLDLYAYAPWRLTNTWSKANGDLFVGFTAPPRQTFQPIPEPSTLAIWSLLGALGISVGWWRRKRKAA